MIGLKQSTIKYVFSLTFSELHLEECHSLAPNQQVKQNSVSVYDQTFGTQFTLTVNGVEEIVRYLLASLQVLHEHLLAAGNAHVATHLGSPVATLPGCGGVEHFS